MSAITWMFAALLMFLTIIGIPWARATFNIGLLVIWPFGSKVIPRNIISGDDIGTSYFGFMGNIVWFLLAGWWLFLYHFLWTLLFGVTIIGIPFALQFWKLAKISLSPIGKKIIWIKLSYFNLDKMALKFSTLPRHFLITKLNSLVFLCLKIVSRYFGCIEKSDIVTLRRLEESVICTY